MHVKNTYPKVTKVSRDRKRMLNIVRWPFLAVAVVAPIVNLCIGGPLWCILVILSLWIVWKMVLSPDLVELNRISQSIKATVWSSILIAVVDLLFVNNHFAIFVIPIVCFAGLANCIVLFFTNLETQKHNMLPLINFIFASIIGSLIALHFYHGRGDWPIFVLLGLSVLSLFSLIIVLGQDFKIEMKRRFHIK
jgi:lipid-A-disaccharide synthase-like uncharacterized protein